MALTSKSPMWLPILLFSMLAGLSSAGSDDETARWQASIDAVSAKGGGRVTVPAGRHLVGQLDLRSNVELHLEEGAVLEGQVGLGHYRVLTLPYSEGTWSAVVSAVGVTNVAVTGGGEIFGNGAGWPQPHDYGNNQEGQRARGLFFADCHGVRLEDFRLRDAACWGVVFKCSRDIVVRRVRIDSHANANNDGFDVEAADVLIEDCDVDSGDDAYCIKSNDPGFSVENVTVRNSVGRSHCCAFKIGTASHGTMRNIRFENCRAEVPRREFVDRRLHSENYGKGWFHRNGYDDYPLGVGISAIAVECVDGGIVEDVLFSDVEFSGYMVPIFVRGGLRTERACGTPPGKSRILRNVTLENIRGRGEGPVANSISGVDGCRVENIRLRNVEVLCRGASAEASSNPSVCQVPYRPNGYPEACGCFHPCILPAYGLYVDRADVSLENVSFRLVPGSADVRPDVCLPEMRTRPFPVSYGKTLRDRSWMWGHESWQVDGKHAKLFGLDVATNYYHMVEGAKSYGLENLNVIRWDKPDRAFRDSLRGMKRLTWPISGNAGETHTTYAELGDWTFAVAEEMDNVTGFELDDYFVSTNETSTFARTPAGTRAVCPTRFPYDDLIALKRRMKAFRRPLELRLVVYDDLFKERRDPRDLAPVIDVVDSVTYWVWMADNIVNLEKTFAQYRELAPKKPTYLGIYLWDFGGAKPMPVDLLQKQLETGLKWFRKGEIEGFVFLCSSICNRPYPAVSFCREWLVKHGDESWGSGDGR